MNGITEEQIQGLVEARDVAGAVAALEEWRQQSGRSPDEGLLIAAEALQHGAGRLVADRLVRPDGTFDGSRFNAVVRFLSFYGLQDLAAGVVGEVEQIGLLPGGDQRLESAKSVIDGVRRQFEEFTKHVESGAYEPVRLTEAREFERRPMPDRLPLDTEADLVCFQTGSRIADQPSTFDQDFAELPADQREALLAAGFDRGHTETDVERVFLARDVRFCISNEDVATAFTGQRRTRAIRASRYAKASSLNIAAPVTDQIPAAYVLPFAHNYVNYYHAIAETAAGLRSVHRVPDHVPIVYVEDRFGVLPFVFERLGLDPSRLVAAKDLETTLVACAYWPDPPPFLWASWVYDFFGALGSGDIDRRYRRVYLSRARSVRSFDNEADVESALAHLGYQIVYAEDLDIDEQAHVFGAADVIVAPHGAGLTNLVFSRSGTRLVELFPSTFVKPNFYLRSKHLGVDYRAMVVSDNTVDLSLLLQLVGSVDRPWAPGWLAAWSVRR